MADEQEISREEDEGTKKRPRERRDQEEGREGREKKKAKKAQMERETPNSLHSAVVDTKKDVQMGATEEPKGVSSSSSSSSPSLQSAPDCWILFLTELEKRKMTFESIKDGEDNDFAALLKEMPCFQNDIQRLQITTYWKKLKSKSNDPSPRAQRKRKRDETEEFFSKPTVELQSITLRWNQHILRDELVQWCWEKFQREKVVLLSSPAGSGKTVLMKLFAAAYGNTINLVELDFTNPQTPAELLLGVGIDVNAPRECQINQETIIMVDDVQAKYSDTGFWTYFLKSVLPKLPLTVRFLLSATHILQAGPNPSPANFSEFSRLKIADFKLSNSQCETVLDLAAKAVGLSHVFKEYLKFRRCIVLESQGLVGAIRVAVKATYDHFHGHGDFSEEDAFGFYFSSKYDEYLGRCFSGGFMQLPHNAPLLRSLRECLVHTKLGVRKFLSSLGAESQKLFYQMMAAGIITEKDGYVEFTSQLAQRYFCYLLFSNRSADPSPLSFGKAIIQALRNISAYSLSQSVIPEPDPSFPKEPTFQHLFMDALMAVTPPSARVLCPEFSKIFPTVAGDADDNDNGDGDDDYVQSDFVNADWNVLGKGVEEVKEGVDEAEEGEGSQDDEEKEEEKEGKEKEGTKKINGEIDFYVDGPLRWGFELVVQGREIQEHMKRFRKNTGGKYAPLRMTKYAVIDFRQSKGGKVSNDLKKKQERHRVSVVFEKGGDFRQCQVLLGKSPKIFLVHLSP